MKSSEKLVGLDFVNATLRSEFTQPFNKSSRDKLTFNKNVSEQELLIFQPITGRMNTEVSCVIGLRDLQIQVIHSSNFDF